MSCHWRVFRRLDFSPLGRWSTASTTLSAECNSPASAARPNPPKFHGEPGNLVRLQRRGQHPAGTLTDHLAQDAVGLTGRVVDNSPRHRRPFLTGAPTPGAYSSDQR